MGDISNKSLAALLVVAIVVSVVGTWLVMIRGPGMLTMTGRQTSQIGTAQITVAQNASLTFSVSSLDFGTGYVDTRNGATLCNINTLFNTTTGCTGFVAAPSLQILNDGNTRLSVTLNASKGSLCAGPAFCFLDLIGAGDGSSALYLPTDPTGSCLGALTPGVWAGFATTNPPLCNNLQQTTGNASLNINLNVTIGVNQTVGAHNVTFTAFATNLGA